MNRNTLIAVLAVVIAILVLWFLFFSTGGPEVVGDGLANEQELEVEVED